MAEFRPGVFGPLAPASAIDVGIPESVRKEGPFLPNPMLSDVTLRVSTWRATAEAQHAIVRLDEAVGRLPDPALMVRSTQVREARHVLRLEGMPTGLREVLAMGLPEPPSAEKPVAAQIVRYLRVCDAAVSWASDGPVGKALFGPVAAALAAPLNPGASQEFTLDTSPPWRSVEHWLGVPDGGYLWAAPPGADLQARAEQLVTWIDRTGDLPLIGKVALGAYQFGTLAPLENSETLVWLYILMELIRGQALRNQVLPIAVWFDRTRQNWRIRHRAVVDHGDLDGWVTFVAEGIIALCGQQMALIRDLNALRMEFVERLGQREGVIVRVAEGLIGNPVINNLQVEQRYEVTAKYSRNLVKQLAGLGLVEPFGTQKQFKTFVATEVIRKLGIYEGRLPPEDRDANKKSDSTSC